MHYFNLIYKQKKGVDNFSVNIILCPSEQNIVSPNNIVVCLVWTYLEQIDGVERVMCHHNCSTKMFPPQREHYISSRTVYASAMCIKMLFTIVEQVILFISVFFLRFCFILYICVLFVLFNLFNRVYNFKNFSLICEI